jgi:tetratricopeptide (TPR) repeat protein
MIHGSLARGLSAAALAFSIACACNPAPEHASEHVKRGDAAMLAGRYAQALAAYSHARELAPHDTIVQRAMMRARVHLIAEDAARLTPEAFEDARYEATFLLESDTTHAHVYHTALGNVLFRQGDVEGAKAKFAEALKVTPGSALAHTALGVVLMTRKETSAQAKAEFEAALAVKPDALVALLGLGQIKLAEGDLPGAVDRLEAALRIRDDFVVRMALGNARAQQQKPTEAVEHFQRAVQHDPKSAEALSSLGQALLNANRAEDAERALRGAIQLRPDPGTSIALGFALARQKKLEPALALFVQILAHDASAAPALYGAGTASEELDKKEQALEYYQRLLALPTAGAQRQMITDLQHDAQSRAKAITAALAAASASASASAPPRPAPRR